MRFRKKVLFSQEKTDFDRNTPIPQRILSQNRIDKPS
jgi:hypothetical protein